MAIIAYKPICYSVQFDYELNALLNVYQVFEVEEFEGMSNQDHYANIGV